jgi:type IV pilus assembly protein PilE
MQTQGYKRHQGFTLIELMITVGIIAILAGIAWPSFERQIAANKRKDAIKALSTASNAMEKCRTDNGSYTNCGGVFKTTSQEGRYAISVQIGGNGDSYTLTATPNANDADCATLTLNNLGQKGSTGNYTNPHQCWGD